MKKQLPMDRKKVLREAGRLTRPPRLEGKAKNAGINPTRKKSNIARKNGNKKR